MNVKHKSERYFAMSQHDALKAIAYLSGVIGLLAGRWRRPQSALEAAILTQLLDVRETVRAAYESDQQCQPSFTLPAFFEAASLFALAAGVESLGEGWR